MCYDGLIFYLRGVPSSTTLGLICCHAPKPRGCRAQGPDRNQPLYLVHMQASHTQVIQEGLPPGPVCVSLVLGGAVLLLTQPQVFLPNKDKVCWEATGTEAGGQAQGCQSPSWDTQVLGGK